MKKINFYKAFILLSLFLSVKAGFAQCGGSFTYTLGNGGQVTFASTATTSTSFTQYNWNFGFTSSVIPAPTTTVSVVFPSNTMYVVNLNALGSCTISASQTIVITTAGCNVAATFTATPGLMGNVSFNATATGTIPATTYTMNYGDNTSGLGLNSTHQYTANGIYTVTLTAANNTSCTSVYVQTVSVTNACNPASVIAPGFVSTGYAGGNVTFTSTSTNTTASTVYSWTTNGPLPIFSPTVLPGGMNTPTTTFNYASNGAYMVELTVYNLATPTCSYSTTNTITVNTAGPPCTLTPGFAYTQGGNGSVNFSNTSTGTISSTSYTLQYGDGNLAINSFSPHVYSTNGTYNATLTASNGGTCNGSQTLSINITSIAPPCTLTPGFTYAQGTNGNIIFSNTTTGTTSSTSYTLQYGDGNVAINSFAPHVYSANGTYTATLTAVNNSTCNGSHVLIINVTNVVPPCTLAPGFTYSSGTYGTVTFFNTTTGTISSTSYTLHYGDGSSGNGFAPHTYTVNGTYIATLTAYNSATCTGSQTVSINVTNICAASFIYTDHGSGNVTFTSTSSPALPGDLYTWNFGVGTFTSTNINATVNYTANGQYLTSLQYISGTCVSNYTSVISITSFTAPCTLSVSFAHTVSAGGAVNFAGTSAATGSNIIYTWDFGNGSQATGQYTTHVFASNGSYPVKLLVRNALNTTCRDSAILSLNITGAACNAVANFTLAPSDTAQVWSATPAAPWNIASAAWSWGDGSSSSLLYTSHTYSAPGNYNICLSVTVACGGTSSVCTQYNLYKATGESNETGMVKINVIDPGPVASGINGPTVNDAGFDVYPNPGSGLFNLKPGKTAGVITIAVYDMVGSLVYTRQAFVSEGTEEQLDLGNVAAGIYFIKLVNRTGSCTKKLVINK